VTAEAFTPGAVAVALEARRAASDARLESFREGFARHLDRALDLLGEHTTVYATGSGGRGELSAHSDLDVFLLRRGRPASTLDSVELQAAVVRALREAGFPPPSRDGEFLRMHTAERLVANIGKPEDDAENTFTARMLLLLESRALAGRAAHAAAVSDVIAAYWRNADYHPRDYLPIVLVNDIVRYWRILLLNYESKNTERLRELPHDRVKADLRLRSYKLRFSRCMTCYSFLLALLAASKRHGHVGVGDVSELVRSSPMERLAHIAQSVDDQEVTRLVDTLRERYAEFLARTAQSKDTLDGLFADPAYRRARLAEGDAFGDVVFALVLRLGADNKLFRYMVV
jgi:hypothetical protein